MSAYLAKKKRRVKKSMYMIKGIECKTGQKWRTRYELFKCRDSREISEDLHKRIHREISKMNIANRI